MTLYPTSDRRYGWTSPGIAQHCQRAHQLKGYQTGEALSGHILAAHGGQFNADCFACRELKLKTELAKKAG